LGQRFVLSGEIVPVGRDGEYAKDEAVAPVLTFPLTSFASAVPSLKLSNNDNANMKAVVLLNGFPLLGGRGGVGRKGLKEPDPDMAVSGELYFNP
jgi:hypothetical protein